MKYCKTCKLSFHTPLDKCLFCNNSLEELPNTPKEYFLYPSFQKVRHTRTTAMKLVSFFAALAAVLCVYIDIKTKSVSGLTWSRYVVASILYGTLNIFLFTSHRRTIKKVTYCIYLTVLLLLCIGFFGQDAFWALDFIYPFGIIGTILCLTLYYIFWHRKELHDLAIYILIACLLGLLPFFRLAFGAPSYSWPSIACIGYSLVTIIGLLFFSTEKTKEELLRRFHI